jgi:hypothetical protein
MREELRHRLASEYRYAVTKMQETTQAIQKMFYFSVFFGESQRILNLEWNAELALIHMVTLHVHTQINTTLQTPPLMQALPIDWTSVINKLTEVSSDLAAYFEKAGNESSKEELCRILECFAEIDYATSGNGSYLYGKGAFKL